MYTGLGAFNFSSILQKAQTAVQKVQSAAKKVKQSAEQFLPPEAVKASSGETLMTPPSTTEAAASAAPLSPSGFPVIPAVLAAGGVGLFLLAKMRKRGRK